MNVLLSVTSVLRYIIFFAIEEIWTRANGNRWADILQDFESLQENRFQPGDSLPVIKVWILRETAEGLKGLEEI